MKLFRTQRPNTVKLAKLKFNHLLYIIDVELSPIFPKIKISWSEVTSWSVNIGVITILLFLSLMLKVLSSPNLPPEICPISHTVFTVLYNRSHILHYSVQMEKVPACLGLSPIGSWPWHKVQGQVFWGMRTGDRQGAREAVLTVGSLLWVTIASFHQGNTQTMCLIVFPPQRLGNKVVLLLGGDRSGAPQLYCGQNKSWSVEALYLVGGQMGVDPESWCGSSQPAPLCLTVWWPGSGRAAEQHCTFLSALASSAVDWGLSCIKPW